jgi:hypothetical protein
MEIINEKLNDYTNYEVYFLNDTHSIYIELSDRYKFLFTRKIGDRDKYNTYFIRGSVIIPYKDETRAYFIHEKTFNKIHAILDGISPTIEKFCVRDTTKKILHSIKCSEEFKREQNLRVWERLEKEKWIYDKSLIKCDDKFYIFRVRSNDLSDNENDTLITTWRNICEKRYLFIAFQELPPNPMLDFVQNVTN